MNNTFTIVTACYNSEKWINNCIESVANQKYDKSLVTHLILDDGSTDNTGNIVKNLMKIYPHVQYIKKPNGNWGSVINYVKKNKLVCNDYVLILDSDDSLSKNALNIVNKNINNADVFIGSYSLTNNKTKSFKIKHPYSFTLSRIQKANNKKFVFPLYWWIGAIYVSKDVFYQTTDLRENVPFQDSIYIPNAFSLATTIRFTYKKVGNYWAERPGNTTTSETATKYIYIYILLKWWESNNTNSQYDEIIWQRLIWENPGFLQWLIKNKIKVNKPKNSKLCSQNFVLIRPLVWIFYKIKIIFRSKYLKQIFR